MPSCTRMLPGSSPPTPMTTKQLRVGTVYPTSASSTVKPSLFLVNSTQRPARWCFTISKPWEYKYSPDAHQCARSLVQLTMALEKRSSLDSSIYVIGVRPRDDVSCASGSKGRIVVQDNLKTSTPDIYAIGEMCGLRGKYLWPHRPRK